MSNTILTGEDLYDAVKQWAVDRNLLGAERATTFNKQLLKTHEEFGELISAWFKGKHDEAVDAVGDMLVTLIIANEINRERGLHFLERNAVLLAENEVQFAPACAKDNSAMFYRVLKALQNYHEGESLHSVLIELGILAHTLGISLQYSLLTAYSQIKDRKGETRDGVFVKADDLNGGDNAQDNFDNGTSEASIEDETEHEKTNGVLEEPAFEPAPVPDEQGVEGFVETTDGQADTETAGEAKRSDTSTTEEDETAADTRGANSEGGEIARPSASNKKKSS